MKNEQLKSKLAFLILGFSICITIVHGQSTSELISAAAAKIEPLAEAPFTVNVSDSLRTYASPEGIITIGADNLATRLATVPDRLKPTVMAMVIGHEAAHVAQYHRFLVAGDYASTDWTRVFEAEADIMAGYFGYKSADAGTIEPNHYSLLTCPEVAKFFASMGLERYARGQHPSRTARILAVTLGMNVAWLEQLEQSAKHGNQSAKQQATAVRANLPFSFSRFTIDWRIQVAKALTHFNRDALQYLTVTETRPTFDADRSHPFVTARYQFNNTGTRPIRVTSEVSLMFGRRESSADPVSWLRSDSDWKTYVLAPDSKSPTQTVALQWLNAEYTELGHEYLPMVHGLDSDEALWYGEYADVPEMPPSGPTEKSAQTMAAGPEEVESVQSWINALNSIISAARSTGGLESSAGPWVIESPPAHSKKEDRFFVPTTAIAIGISVPRGQLKYVKAPALGMPDYLSVSVICNNDGNYFDETLAFLKTAIEHFYPDMELLQDSKNSCCWRARSNYITIDLMSTKEPILDSANGLDRTNYFIDLHVHVARPAQGHNSVPQIIATNLDSLLLGQ